MRTLLPVVVVAALLMPAACAWAAEGDVSWSRHFGWDYHQRATCITPAADGGCVVAGWAEHEYGGPRNMYAVRVTGEGDSLWSREYGGDDWYSQGAYGICPSGDGGFVLVGHTDEFGYWSDGWVVRTDAAGAPMWSGHYGGNNWENVWGVCPAGDGGFVFTGNTGSSLDGSLWVAKVNGDGEYLWGKGFGGTDTAEGHGITPTDDGGFVVAGYINFWSGDHGEDMYVLRLDADGDTLWTRSFGGTGSDRAMSVCPAGDGGFLVAGYTSSFGAGSWDMYLVKVDATGGTVWTRTYGRSTPEQATSIYPSGDGGFLLAGYTGHTSNNCPNMYLVKVSAAGDTLWTHTYDECYESFADAVCVSGGGIYVAGPGTGPDGGFYDMYLVKAEGAGGAGVPSLERDPDAAAITLHQATPNPFHGGTRIDFSLKAADRVELVVLDAQGRRVAAREWPHLPAGAHAITWDGSGLASGTYFARLSAGGGSRTLRLTLVK